MTFTENVLVWAQLGWWCHKGNCLNWWSQNEISNAICTTERYKRNTSSASAELVVYLFRVSEGNGEFEWIGDASHYHKDCFYAI